MTEQGREDGRLAAEAELAALREENVRLRGLLGLDERSDDAGEQWSASRQPVNIAGDPRGMAEPAVVELTAGRLLMLARESGASVSRNSVFSSWPAWAKSAACSTTAIRRNR